MSAQKSRRDFLITLGALAAITALPVEALANTLELPLYPPIDLSYFDTPIKPAASASQAKVKEAVRSSGDQTGSEIKRASDEPGIC